MATVLIPYLVLELLDLSLGHCVFDLELWGAERRQQREERAVR